MQPYKWYTHCPGITPKSCGGHQFLIPIGDKQTWGHLGLKYAQTERRWKSKDGDKYESCWWSIHVPEYTWKTARIKIKFTTIEEGINIHLYGTVSKEAKDLKTEIIKDDKTPTLDEIYSLD